MSDGKKGSAEAAALPERLRSLDALRGFDMLWIIGGERVIRELAKLTEWGWMWGLNRQMRHVNWAGFHFYDLIFPLFMFISGVSIPYSIESKRSKDVSERKITLSILRRVALLILLGLIYNGMLRLDFSSLRVFSVLGQIGVAYGVAALVYQFSKSWKTVALWMAGILLVYAAAQMWIPVPGHGAGVLTAKGSLNSYIDRLLATGHIYTKFYDPEGLLCVVSASTVTLAGALAGILLRRDSVGKSGKAAVLAGAGLGVLALGTALSFVYPAIKKLWTPSFDLVTIGCSALLLCLFYSIIDILGFRKWAFPFVVIGTNSIAIYMACKFVDFHHAASFFFGGLAAKSGSAGGLVMALGVVAVEWALLYVMYRKKIFVKV